MNKQCDYKQCESEAFRHFFGRHFCNEHNWYLRRKAQREQVSDLDEWLTDECRTRIERIIEQERDVLDALDE